MKLLRTTFHLAYTALQTYGFRTFLTVLGVVVGVMTVVTIMSVGNGAQQVIIQQLESFGGNTIFTEVRVPVAGASPASAVEITTLKEADMKLVEQLPNVLRTYGVVMGQERLTGPQGKLSTTIMGTDPAYLEMNAAGLAAGQFFTERELQRNAQVVVLGAEVAQILFGAQEAVGKFVRVRGVSYVVVGVMKEQGTVLFQNMDTMVYIPRTTVQKRLLGIDYLLYFVTEVIEEETIEQTAEHMRLLLRRAHRLPPNTPDKDDFLVMTMGEALVLMQTLTSGIQLGLLLVAAVSLVVGGVGIMNTMYVGVIERTREIGIRRAIGASRAYILWQFLMESLIITTLGGILGVVFGCLVSLGIAWIAQYAGFGWTYPIAWEGIGVAYGMALFFGLVFGYFPARKAAYLDPVEALRSA